MFSLSTSKYTVNPLEAPDSKALHGYVIILELSKYPRSMFQDMVSLSNKFVKNVATIQDIERIANTLICENWSESVLTVLYILAQK
jgi:hypothetical protein